MHHIVETSLFITHSRHDINAFLASRPALAYSSLDAIVRDGKYDSRLDLVDPIMTGPAHPTDDSGYYHKLAAREAFQRAVVSVVAANELDALCFPCTQVLPPTRAELDAGKWTVLSFPTNTLIPAQTWRPSICLLPVGMEIVVPPYHEPDLFRLGYAFERATGYRRPPASAPAL